MSDRSNDEFEDATASVESSPIPVEDVSQLGNIMKLPTEGRLGYLTAEQELLLCTLWQSFLSALAPPTASKQNAESSFARFRAKFSRPKDESIEGVADEFWYLLGAEDPDVMLLRFLRARKWDVDRALSMMMNALRWRVQFNVRKLLIEGDSCLSRSEMESGKNFFHGRDRAGRLVGILRVRLHLKNASTAAENERFTVYQMEMARKQLAQGTETVSVLFDLSGFSMANMDYPAVKFLITCFEGLYPESLGICLVVNAPWIFSPCWSVIKPWLDPNVRAKIHFVKVDDLDAFIDSSQRLVEFGGSDPYLYRYNPGKPKETPPSEETVRSYEEAREKLEQSTRAWIESMLSGKSDDSLKSQRDEAKKQFARACIALQTETEAEPPFARE